jgi:hypothetical protein
MSEKRFLITQTLLSSLKYVYSCKEGQEDAAYEDFLLTLKREKGEPNEAMLKGREFEDEVYKEAAGASRLPHPEWEEGIRAVATLIKGAQTQVIASREMDVAGRKFLIYGVLDALKAGVIYDVKFTVKSLTSSSSSYDVGKYLDSPQHPVYLAMLPEAYEFRYLVSDGTDVATETYNRRGTRPIEDLIAEFLSSVESMGLLPLYEERWLAKS